MVRVPPGLPGADDGVGRVGVAANWRACGALGKLWRQHRLAFPTAAQGHLVRALLEMRSLLMPHSPGGCEQDQLLDMLAQLAGKGERNGVMVDTLAVGSVDHVVNVAAAIDTAPESSCDFCDLNQPSAVQAFLNRPFPEGTRALQVVELEVALALEHSRSTKVFFEDAVDVPVGNCVISAVDCGEMDFGLQDSDLEPASSDSVVQCTRDVCNDGTEEFLCALRCGSDGGDKDQGDILQADRKAEEFFDVLRRYVQGPDFVSDMAGVLAPSAVEDWLGVTLPRQGFSAETLKMLKSWTS